MVGLYDFMDYSDTDTIVCEVLTQVINQIYDFKLKNASIPCENKIYNFLKNLYFCIAHEEYTPDILDQTKMEMNPYKQLSILQRNHILNLSYCFQFHDFLIEFFKNKINPEQFKKTYLQTLQSSKKHRIFYFCTVLEIYVIFFEIWSVLFAQCRDSEILKKIPFFLKSDKLISKKIRKHFDYSFQSEVKYFHDQINPFYFFLDDLCDDQEDTLYFIDDFSYIHYFESDKKTFHDIPKKYLFVPYYSLKVLPNEYKNRFYELKLLRNNQYEEFNIKDTSKYTRYLLSEINLLQMNITALLNTLFQKLDSTRMKEFFTNHVCNYVIKNKF
jgi:hypothetical protein